MPSYIALDRLFFRPSFGYICVDGPLFAYIPECGGDPVWRPHGTAPPHTSGGPESSSRRRGRFSPSGALATTSKTDAGPHPFSFAQVGSLPKWKKVRGWGEIFLIFWNNQNLKKMWGGKCLCRVSIPKRTQKNWDCVIFFRKNRSFLFCSSTKMGHLCETVILILLCPDLFRCLSVRWQFIMCLRGAGRVTLGLDPLFSAHTL